MAQNFTTTVSTLVNLETVMGAGLQTALNSGSKDIAIAITHLTVGETLWIGTGNLDADTNAFPLETGQTISFLERQLGNITFIDNGIAIDIRRAIART